ncbi:hypothetical protein EPO04_02590 [Patescibacteria group bacterium]|nr:MAG: hypothetical protein EPO04_02590 [Patescibacteria group bacterium]
MIDSRKLIEIANRYKLSEGGVEFWTPYWRDEVPSHQGEHPVRGLYNGKGSPDEIQEALEQHIGQAKGHLKTGNDYRQFMASIRLGVDCSGFIFHVFDEYLQDQGLNLADYLYKDRTALLKDFFNPAYTHPPHITEDLLQSQPEHVSLAKIQEFWGNQPVRLAGVRILTSLAANEVVPTVNKIRPGDQIVMDGRNVNIPHHILVVEVTGDKLMYVHSGRLDVRAEGEVGGVEYGVITITNPNKPINHQDWHNQQLFNEHVMDDDCQRRLKVFNEL